MQNLLDSLITQRVHFHGIFKQMQIMRGCVHSGRHLNHQIKIETVLCLYSVLNSSTYFGVFHQKRMKTLSSSVIIILCRAAGVWSLAELSLQLHSYLWVTNWTTLHVHSLWKMEPTQKALAHYQQVLVWCSNCTCTFQPPDGSCLPSSFLPPSYESCKDTRV